MPSKLKKAAKVGGKVLGAAASFVPGGGLVKAGLGIAGKLMGAGGKGGIKKKRRFSLMAYQRKLIKAKLDARIQKTKLSAFKGL